MEDDAAREMARSLVRETGAGERIGSEAADQANQYLGDLLASLPDAVDSAVFSAEGGKAKGLIVADERLYVVDGEVGPPPSPAQPSRPLIRVVTTAHPYDPREWSVSLESQAAADLTDGAAGFRTAWTFAYRGERVVEVRGEVHLRPKEAVNRSEAFARSLAKKLGFRIT